MELDPIVPAAAAAAAASAGAPSSVGGEDPVAREIEKDALIMSSKVTGCYKKNYLSPDDIASYNAAKRMKLGWGEYYVPDDCEGWHSSDDDEDIDDNDDAAKSQREEACDEAEDEAMYVEIMASLRMEQVANDAVDHKDDEKGKAPTKLKGPVGNASASELLPFGGIPENLLERIFIYATEKPYEMLHLERVCKIAHRVLHAEGSFWDHHNKFKLRAPVARRGSANPVTTREAIFWEEGIESIQKHQESHDNAILTVLSEYEEGNPADNFRWVASGIMAKMRKSETPGVPCIGTPRLRGDAVGYLAELLEHFAIKRLEAAVILAIHPIREVAFKAVKERFVCVDKSDIMKLDKIRPFSFLDPSPYPRCSVGTKDHHPTSPNSCTCFCPSTDNQWRWPDDDCLVDDVMPAEARRKIVRRIAYRAGVVRLSSKAFDLVAAEIFHLLGVLLVDAYEESRTMDYAPILQNEANSGGLRYNIPGDGIDTFSIPPPPVFTGDDPNDSECSYTIVPGQIKAAAAKRLKGQEVNGVVYGDHWIAGSGFTVEQEKEEEMSYYLPNRSDEFDSLIRQEIRRLEHSSNAAAEDDEDMEYEHESDDGTETETEVDESDMMSIGEEFASVWGHHDPSKCVARIVSDGNIVGLQLADSATIPGN